MAQAWVAVFFAIIGYFRGKYFDAVWWYTPIVDPPKKNNLLIDLIYGGSVFDISK